MMHLLCRGCDKGIVYFVKLLLENGADPNLESLHDYPIHYACSNGSPDVLRLLLQYGADITSIGGDIMYPINFAANAGSTECVKILVEAGQDINAEDGFMNTALHNASLGNHLETAHTLIELGIDINHLNKDKFTALNMCSIHGYFHLTRMLVDNFIDTWIGQYSDLSPLGALIQIRGINDHYYRRTIDFLIASGLW